ncbi:MAG: hypothetical protein JNK05_38335 [Myxococcales bacterium]|nr:hypothetical protein [Myxococcales bacterium]
MAGNEIEGGAALDAYARKYMAAGETVLGFHKQVSRIMLYALGTGVLGGVGMVVYESFAKGRPLNFAALAVMILIVGLYSLLLSAFFGVTRVLVTDKFVRINLGLAGPEIPLGAIESVRATDATYAVGVRPFGDVTTYHSGGATGSVEIIWKKPDGKTHTSVVCLSDPRACASDIQRALAQRTGVRVEAQDTMREAAVEGLEASAPTEVAERGRAS